MIIMRYGYCLCHYDKYAEYRELYLHQIQDAKLLESISNHLYDHTLCCHYG